MLETKRDIIERLRKDILLQEGYKPATSGTAKINGLEQVEAAFPNAVFPAGMIHEFVNTKAEHAAACGGFIAGLLNSLIPANGGICLWVSVKRTLFPPALKEFGIEPDQLIFVDVTREKEVLWITEEALKCEGFSAVIAELQEFSFIQSRRMQLATEQSKVTGFILRNDLAKLTTTACAARWQITPLLSQPEGGLPGVGFSRWQVELSKVRNGHPGLWQVEWRGKSFALIGQQQQPLKENLKIRKAG